MHSRLLTSCKAYGTQPFNHASAGQAHCWLLDREPMRHHSIPCHRCQFHAPARHALVPHRAKTIHLPKAFKDGHAGPNSSVELP